MVKLFKNSIKKVLPSALKAKDFTAKDVCDAYRIILGREPENKNVVDFQEYVNFARSINYKFEKVILSHNYLIIPEDYRS